MINATLTINVPLDSAGGMAQTGARGEVAAPRLGGAQVGGAQGSGAQVGGAQGGGAQAGGGTDDLYAGRSSDGGSVSEEG